MQEPAPRPRGEGRAPRPELVLASSSPRRLQLLEQLGIVPDRVLSPDIDETPLRDELPRAYAVRMVHGKLAAVASADPAALVPEELVPAALVLAADTVVALGRRILPRADTEAEARRCLSLISGRRHSVLTAVALRGPDGKTRLRVVDSVVALSRLTERQIDALIAAGDWRGKAGGYAIQGRIAGFVRFLSGSYSGVVGLPLFETAQLLRGCGWPD